MSVASLFVYNRQSLILMRGIFPVRLTSRNFAFILTSPHSVMMFVSKIAPGMYIASAAYIILTKISSTCVW